MTAYKALIRPFLFRFDAEKVHDFVSKALPMLPAMAQVPSNSLSSTVAGLTFPSPVGLAAGFDKDARTFRNMYRHGFGSVEVGTLTPHGQPGNPRPRIFRIAPDEAIINRMGFPNDGIQGALPRLKGFKIRPGPLGVNIGANKDTVEKIDDYVYGYKAVADVADYVTINVSSPNTPGLRELEKGDYLNRLLRSLEDSIESLCVPVFVKVSPDLSDAQIDEACEILLKSNASGVIVGNTTLSRPESDKINAGYKQSGGLSGAPLRDRSLAALDRFVYNINKNIAIVSVGGVASAEDVYDRVRRGASLVQLYTSFIYEGPALVGKINKELELLLKRDNLSSIGQAVGSKHSVGRATRLSSDSRVSGGNQILAVA